MILKKTTIIELLSGGFDPNAEIYVMFDDGGAEGLYAYYMAVLSRLFGVSTDWIMSKTRADLACKIRAMAWVRLADHDKWSLVQIAECANRSRSNIYLVSQSFRESLKVDPSSKKMYDAFCYSADNNRNPDNIQPFDFSFKNG